MANAATTISLDNTCAIALTAFLAAACSTEPAGTELHGETMGTSWTVRLRNCGDTTCADLQAQLEARLEELNQHLSHYDPEAELSAFNRLQSDEWFPVSTDLATVVAEAQRVSIASNGAFDITVAPAVDAWGFGPDTATGQQPDPDMLELARKHSGYRKLELREDGRALRKRDPQLRLDLSAIAPGYAVDQLAYLLETRGIQDYLVDIGGEVRTAGVRPDGKGWHIGIESPDAALPIEYVVVPGDAAVATSGDYRNFYVLDGKRIGHTLDPATAQPVSNGLTSVSVIAPDAMQADALATTLMVLGPEAGLAFAEQRGIPALLMTGEGGRQVLRTTAFEPYLAK